MKELSKQITEFLHENIPELIEGTNLLIDTVPSSPDFIVAVLSTGGATPDRYLPTADPTIQIWMRGLDNEEMKEMVDEIVGLMHNKYNFKFVDDGNYIYTCNLMGEPATVGQDENRRTEISMNFILHLRR